MGIKNQVSIDGNTRKHLVVADIRSFWSGSENQLIGGGIGDQVVCEL